jgi:hypothetical protein
MSEPPKLTGALSTEEHKKLKKCVKKNPACKAKDIIHEFPGRNGHSLGAYIKSMKGEVLGTGNKAKLFLYFVFYLHFSQEIQRASKKRKKNAVATTQTHILRRKKESMTKTNQKW